jgi:hypothetical protein
MKTAGRENPNRWANASRNRAQGADGQNKSCSIQWAAKQEKFRPKEMYFFLTSTFIELTRSLLGLRATVSSEIAFGLLLEGQLQPAGNAPRRRNCCPGKQARKVDDVHAVCQIGRLNLQDSTALFLAVDFKPCAKP